MDPSMIQIVTLACSNTCCRKLVLASFSDHHLFHAVRFATLVELMAGWIPAPPSCTAASIRLARTHSLENQDINSRSNTSLSSTNILINPDSTHTHLHWPKKRQRTDANASLASASRDEMGKLFSN